VHLSFGCSISHHVVMAEPQEPAQSKHGEHIARRYPMLSAAELEEVKDTLRQYVALALRVFERLESDPEAMARFEALTTERRASRINHKGPVNNPQPNP